jgi:hypothetical protein
MLLAEVTKHEAKERGNSHQLAVFMTWLVTKTYEAEIEDNYREKSSWRLIEHSAPPRAIHVRYWK